MTDILYLAPTMNDASLILQEIVEELFESGIDCRANKAGSYIITPHCKVQFLAWSMGEKKFKGRFCDIAINFPDEWRHYLTRGSCNTSNGDKSLFEIITEIEKGEKR